MVTKKFIPLVVSVGAAALALAMVTASQAGKGDIFGTDHDVGSPGNPTCAQCHIPHEAGEKYLWGRVPYSPYAGESQLLPLCYSCHDRSVATSGNYIPAASDNHPQGVLMYDPTHDGDMSDAYPITEHSMYESYCKKCMQPDCLRCHDPHSDAWVFLDAQRFDAVDYDGDTAPDTDTMNASMCVWCHEGWRHGVQSYNPDHNPIPNTTHPEMVTAPEGAADTDLPADRTWDGDTADFSGTRLWSDDTIYSNALGVDDTSQYVVGSGPGDIRCMSCHTAHGGQNDKLTSMATSTSSDSRAPMCENCHE